MQELSALRLSGSSYSQQGRIAELLQLYCADLVLCADECSTEMQPAAALVRKVLIKAKLPNKIAAGRESSIRGLMRSSTSSDAISDYESSGEESSRASAGGGGAVRSGAKKAAKGVVVHPRLLALITLQSKPIKHFLMMMAHDCVAPGPITSISEKTMMQLRERHFDQAPRNRIVSM